VAGDRALLGLGRPFADRDGVDDLALAAVDALRAARPADRAYPAEVRYEPTRRSTETSSTIENTSTAIYPPPSWPLAGRV
jgi:hypothetical protein